MLCFYWNFIIILTTYPIQNPTTQPNTTQQSKLTLQHLALPTTYKKKRIIHNIT